MATPTPQNPGLLNWLLIIFLGILWGGAFLSTRLALEGFGPWTVAAGRISIAALALALVGAAAGQGINQIRSRRAWLSVVAFGLISVAVALSLLSWGQQYVLSAFAGVSMGAVPLLILPLAAVFSREEGIGPRRIIGLGLGFTGLLVLIGPQAFGQSGAPLEFWGQLACFGTACCYAIGSIITRKSPKMPPLAFAAAGLIVASLVVVPIAIIKEGLPHDLFGRPSAALLFAALGPTALAAVIRVRVITTAGTIFMSLTSYMVPVWSVVFGITLMRETLPPQLIWGLILILSGIGLSQSRGLRAWLKDQ